MARQSERMTRAGAAWEQIVAQVGDEARGLVEAYGDEAVAALRACSVSVAKQLSQFFTQGGLDKFPRPRDFLVMVSNPKNGDEACLWALQPQHADKLDDVDYFNAYLASPLEYALGLKSLANAAAQLRTKRLAAQSSEVGNAAAAAPRQASILETDSNVRSIVIVLTIVAVGSGIVLWLKKRTPKSADASQRSGSFT